MSVAPVVPGITAQQVEASEAERARRAKAQSRVRWELLTGMVRKDLKVKYQGSVLGFAWSLANPLLQLVVYSFIFGEVLKNGLPNFTFYLISGLLPWTMFTTGVSQGVGSITGNAGLVKKVRFPLVVLPLASVGQAAVNFGLQMIALLFVMIVSGFPLFGWHLLVFVPAFAVLLMLTTAFAVLTGALNARYRDTQHLIEVVLFALFYLNPIVYQYPLIAGKLGSLGAKLYRLNPLSDMTMLFQKALYGHPYGPKGVDNSVPPVHRLILADAGNLFYAEILAYSLVVSGALLWFSMRVFRRMQADFAEEL